MVAPRGKGWLLKKKVTQSYFMNTYFNLNVRVLYYYYLPLQVSSNDLKWSHRRRLNRQLGSTILKIHLRLVTCLLPYRSFTLA